jgi:uncharacterized membrane protein
VARPFRLQRDDPLLSPIGRESSAQGHWSKRRTGQSQWLRLAFAAGAITDALALLLMLFPSLAKLIWGFAEVCGPYQFAVGSAAALMLGWTGLLVWAYRRPIERRAVAVLTILVICALIVAEIFTVLASAVTFWRMVPTWVLQAILLTLLGLGCRASKGAIV